MKRFFVYIMVLLLAFTLTSCSSGSTTSETTEESESTESQESSDSSDSVPQGLAGQILGSWESTGQSGEGTSTTTWTFTKDGKFTLEVSTNAGGESEDMVLSSTSGTYQLNGTSLTIETGGDTDVKDNSSSTEVQNTEVDNNTTIYTVAVNGNELTMTTQEGQAEVYTKAQ